MNPDLPPADALPPTKRVRSNLRQRVVWGSIAAVLLIGCTYGGPISFGLFLAGVQAVMLKEFYRIMRAGGYAPAKWIGIVAGTWLFGITTASLLLGRALAPSLFGTFGGPPAGAGSLAGSAGLAFGVGSSAFHFLLLFLGLPVALWLREIWMWPGNQKPFQNIAVTLGGLLYISLPMSFLSLIALDGGRYDPRHVFCLILLVWAADTGAYFAGKNFGKHKLAPTISPGKTWEGWAGGALLALVVGWAFGQFVPDIPLTHRLVAAGVVAVFGPLGDLAESMLKRSAGVKDSGTFLPGHGGLLDRFDAFLLVLPVLVLLQLLAG